MGPKRRPRIKPFPSASVFWLAIHDPRTANASATTTTRNQEFHVCSPAWNRGNQAVSCHPSHWADDGAVANPDVGSLRHRSIPSLTRRRQVG